MEKKFIRQKMIEERNSLTSLEVQGKSHEVAQLFLALPEYKKATTILTYLATRNEIETTTLIKNSWLQHKDILVPICQPSDKSIIPSKLVSFTDIITGHWNIPEPRPETIQPVSSSKIDLVVLPGMAFDLQGNRIGYGAGYFDRFLLKIPADCPKIALTYDFQVVQSIVPEKHDIPVDIIVTESRIIRITHQ